LDHSEWTAIHPYFNDRLADISMECRRSELWHGIMFVRGTATQLLLGRLSLWTSLLSILPTGHHVMPTIFTNSVAIFAVTSINTVSLQAAFLYDIRFRFFGNQKI
jgi:hypothetical protein